MSQDRVTSEASDLLKDGEVVVSANKKATQSQVKNNGTTAGDGPSANGFTQGNEATIVASTTKTNLKLAEDEPIYSFRSFLFVGSRHDRLETICQI